MRPSHSRFCGGAVPVVDIFGSAAPWWWRAQWHGTESSSGQDRRHIPHGELLTRAQLRQLGLSAQELQTEAEIHGLSSPTPKATRDGSYPPRSLAFPRFPSLETSLAAQACLAHSRVRCEVSLTRGDVRVSHDTADFLSCRGRALGLGDTTALSRMMHATEQFAYTLPFWLSMTDLEMLLRYQAAPFRAYAPSELLGLSNGVFGDDARAVRMHSDRGEVDSFVNVAELLRQPPNQRERDMLFSHFRCFEPLDVATHARFAPRIEDAIRADCVHSGRWCSIWGTEAAFAQCGAPSLIGALGIHVLDPDGDELFLTNALCCDEFMVAYSRVYPERCIYCVF